MGMLVVVRRMTYPGHAGSVTVLAFVYLGGLNVPGQEAHQDEEGGAIDHSHALE